MIENWFHMLFPINVDLFVQKPQIVSMSTHQSMNMWSQVLQIAKLDTKGKWHAENVGGKEPVWEWGLNSSDSVYISVAAFCIVTVTNLGSLKIQKFLANSSRKFHNILTNSW